MKKLAMLAALALAAGIGVIGYGRLTEQRLSAAASASATALMQAYDTIIERDIIPLNATGSLVSARTNLLNLHDGLRARALSPTDIPRLRVFHNALITLLQRGEQEASVSASAKILHAKDAVRPNGPIDTLRLQYNASASAWNERLQKNTLPFASLIAPSSLPLPLLEATEETGWVI